MMTLIIGPFFILFAMGAFIALHEDRLNIPACAAFSAVAMLLFLVEPARSAMFDVIEKIPFTFGFGASNQTLAQTVILVGLPFILVYIAKYARPLAFIKSDLSYGIYLYGWGVQQSLIYAARQHGHVVTHPAKFFFVAMVPTLLIAFASWQLVEKRALALKSVFRRTERPLKTTHAAGLEKTDPL